MHNNQQQKQPERHTQYISGAVLADGTIAELILNEETGKTAFAVAMAGDVSIVESIDLDDGQQALPIPRTNNLIRHRALVLSGIPIDYVSTEHLLADTRAYIARYVDLSPDFLVVASTYVLFSWVHDVFNELPYLRFRGDFGSGKTRALSVIGSLMYKGFFASGASTVSPIFYTLDTFHGSLIIDEADFRFTDKDSDIVKILNNGNVKGFPVLRQSMNVKREFDPRAFQVFGPKIVAMRYSFDDAALESRFLTEEMGQRTVRASIPLNLPESQEDEASLLRCMLLMYRLRERNRVAVQPEFTDVKRAARINQILVPLLSVVPTQGERHAIERVAARIDEELLIDRAQSPEAGVLAILATLFADTEQSYVKISDAASLLAKKVGHNAETTITPRYVGHLVRKRLHLSTHKSHGTYVIPVSERDKVFVLAKRFGVLDES
jgi:hypothetical protein